MSLIEDIDTDVLEQCHQKKSDNRRTEKCSERIEEE